ncbi:hypothetical protein RvY_02280 [Ramazzottius varieornatus]|uniref:Uncharacterized protein n=1 Tax=Ramazzottius varieornatus TaxID=947166 RepID=A0A1D1UJ74_RAMVA|nr:hypothetical protein RvY_02280 [Ramazzottius varieornatus]
MDGVHLGSVVVHATSVTTDKKGTLRSEEASASRGKGSAPFSRAFTKDTLEKLRKKNLNIVATINMFVSPAAYRKELGSR